MVKIGLKMVNVVFECPLMEFSLVNHMKNYYLISISSQLEDHYVYNLEITGLIPIGSKSLLTPPP